MKVKKSEIQLLIAVLGILLVVVTYFLVYAKFNELSDSMESQNMSWNFNPMQDLGWLLISGNIMTIQGI